MLIFLVQWGVDRFHPAPGSLAGPAVLVVACGAIGLVLLIVLGWLVPWIRRRLVAGRRRRRRLEAAGRSEQRARSAMGELCPEGWHARITLYDVGPDEILAAPDDPDDPRDRVALDWAELTADEQPIVVRRVWAPTINAALEAMVIDRRTDETLEQIELMARAQGALWPDLEHGADV
jgi:hypothetical protein